MQVGRTLVFTMCVACAACNGRDEQSERSAPSPSGTSEAHPPSAPTNTAAPAPEDAKPLLAAGEIASTSASGDQALPVARDAAHQRVQRTPDYGFDVARSPDGLHMWVTYDRPAGQPPLLAHYALVENQQARAPSLRMVPMYSPGVSEGGFATLDLEANRVDGDRTPLLRAPPVGESTPSPPLALRDVTRLASFQRCPLRGARRACFVYGTDDELAALAVPRQTARRADAGAVDLPREPMPGAIPADPAKAERTRGDLTLTIARFGDLSADLVNYGLWVTRAGTTSPVFAWKGSNQEGLLSEYYLNFDVDADGTRSLIWVWEEYRTQLSAAWVDNTTLGVVGAPLQFRDTTYDGQEVDCGNVFTDIRPIVVSTPLGPTIGFVQPDADSAVVLDISARRARNVELRMPANVRFAQNLPTLFSLVSTEGGGEAIVSSLGARHD